MISETFFQKNLQHPMTGKGIKFTVDATVYHYPLFKVLLACYGVQGFGAI